MGWAATLRAMLGSGRRRERGRGLPAPRSDPGDGRGAAAGHHHRRARLERQRHAARPGPARAQALGQGRHSQLRGAVSFSVRASAIDDRAHGRVEGARPHAPLVAAIPLIEDDAVRFRPGAGAERGVTNAGHRVQVGVEGLLVARAFVGQAAQSAGPRRAVAREVVGPHLVDHDEHEQGGLAAAARLPGQHRPARGGQQDAHQHVPKSRARMWRHRRVRPARGRPADRCRSPSDRRAQRCSWGRSTRRRHPTGSRRTAAACGCRPRR